MRQALKTRQRRRSKGLSFSDLFESKSVQLVGQEKSKRFVYLKDGNLSGK